MRVRIDARYRDDKDLVTAFGSLPVELEFEPWSAQEAFTLLAPFGRFQAFYNEKDMLWDIEIQNAYD